MEFKWCYTNCNLQRRELGIDQALGVRKHWSQWMWYPSIKECNWFTDCQSSNTHVREWFVLAKTKALTCERKNKLRMLSSPSGDVIGYSQVWSFNKDSWLFLCFQARLALTVPKLLWNLSCFCTVFYPLLICFSLFPSSFCFYYMLDCSSNYHSASYNYHSYTYQSPFSICFI